MAPFIPDDERTVLPVPGAFEFDILDFVLKVSGLEDLDPVAA
jgi:hypothetical protein